MSSEGDDASRQRALSNGVRLARSAIGFVRPFNRVIEGWQRELAFLQATPGSATGKRLVALRRAISEQREAFSAALSRLPPDVAAESRVTDTGRALDRLTAMAEALDGKQIEAFDP